MVTNKGPNLGERTDPPEAPPLAPVGATGLNHGWGQINDEPLLQLRGRRAMREFREMHDNCAVVGGISRLASDMIAQTDWSVEAAGDDSTDHLGKFLLETSLQDMQATWQEFIDEVMSMGPFGHAYMEHWYKKRLGDHDLKEFRSKYADGYYGIANIQLRAQESLHRWNIADDGEILGMWQRPPPTYKIKYVDAHRALHFRTRATRNNPEGRSWYRPGWRSWYFVKRLQEIEGIGIERDVSGYPDYQLPLDYFLQNADDDQKAVLADVKKQVERIRQDKYAGIVRPSEQDREGKPTGFKFSLIQGGSRNAQVFDLVIKRYESRIAISLLGEFVMLGQDKVGSFALSSSKTHMFAIALGAVLRRIEDVINRDLGPRLMRANGLPASCAPEFKFGDIEKEDVQAFTTAISGMVTTGVLTPDAAVERYVRDYLSLPPVGEVSEQQLADAVGERQEQVDQDPASDLDLADAAARNAAEAEPLEQDAAPEPSAFVTLDEATKMLGLSRNQTKAAIRRGDLPGRKIGQSYRILREDLMQAMRGGLGE